MTKQTNVAPAEIDYENLLLKRFRIAEETLEVARIFNREHGIDEATSKANIVYNKTNTQKNYERFLRQYINPDTNQWYTTEFLKAKQLIARIDSPYDGIQYPRREMFQLYRIQSQSGEYLNRREMWYGLDVKGKEVSMYVETLDNHRDVQIQYTKLEEPYQTRYMGDDEDIPGYGKTIAQVSNTHRIYRNQEEGTLVYDTPFSEAAVEEAVKYARGAFNDRNNGCALALIDGSKSSNNSCLVLSLEQFLQPFDQIWNEINRSKDKVDVKDLIRQLQAEKLLDRNKDANEVGVL